MFPIPKNSRWDGLVYLHGLLPAKPDDAALHRLVLTSGDFGLAYLTERWASRFVGELFRNYVVCFVGYSINDPVLRYMMDALAADRMLGEVTPQAYALGDCAPGKERAKTVEWEAKGVSPILYEVPLGSRNHSALHMTLKVWADTYRDGILGKERIVVEYALARPTASTQQDDFVGRMLWALSHNSGLPAKRFAELNPVPPFEWLTAFSEDRYQHDDLSRFGVSPSGATDPKLKFSLIRRPAPYSHAPWMMLLDSMTGSGWDDVMDHIGRWLTRHLNDPQLILWLSGHGGHLHHRWSWLVEQRLNSIADLERDGRTTELDEIRANAPNAIPSRLMRTLWRMLLTGRVKSPSRDPDFFRWRDRLNRNGLTATLRLDMRKQLAPMLRLRKAFRWGEGAAAPDSPERLRQLVDWELVLSADFVRHALQDSANKGWREALPELLPDFVLVLRDALDLLRELGEAGDRFDRSRWDLASIAPHWQNRGFRDWVTLIELVRDSWLAVRDVDAAHATRSALQWFEVPYPTFKRLALFAASLDGVVEPERWLNWLLHDEAHWLWSVETHREVMRLLALQGGLLNASAAQRLEAVILGGPARELYREDLDSERWQYRVDRSVWLRLAKLNESRLRLGESARERLVGLSEEHPYWVLGTHERDEFLHWTSGTGEPDFDEDRNIDIAPSTRAELVQWLEQPPTARRSPFEDTWRDTCRTQFSLSLLALSDLAQAQNWPMGRWQVALQVWSEEGLVVQSWQDAATLVATMPHDVLQELANSISWWLESASHSIERHEAIFLDLCRRVLTVPLDPDSGITSNGEPLRQPVTEAINHPIGHVTQALLHLWLKRAPNDNDCLPADIEPFFSQLCDSGVERFRHGRVLLASRLIALFRVDQIWTMRHLLPLFDWTISATEARSVWEGFLWSPRLYRPLLIAFKSQFLDTANHYAELGEHGRQFSAFLTYAALEPVDGYSSQDFRSAFAALPKAGIEEAAQALSQALDGAGDQRDDYWRNRIRPFWQSVWPKSLELVTDVIAISLVKMCIAAGSEFPSALGVVLDWLRPIEHPHFVVHILWESGLCIRFPLDGLKLLNAVIGDQQWVPEELNKCLNVIQQAAPELERNDHFTRLRAYARRRGN